MANIKGVLFVPGTTQITLHNYCVTFNFTDNSGTPHMFQVPTNASVWEVVQKVVNIYMTI